MAYILVDRCDGGLPMIEYDETAMSDVQVVSDYLIDEPTQVEETTGDDWAYAVYLIVQQTVNVSAHAVLAGLYRIADDPE